MSTVDDAVAAALEPASAAAAEPSDRADDDRRLASG
jgi:hypothetical protein